MTDSEHGPDSSTPPEPSGKSQKGTRQRRRRKGARKTTAKKGRRRTPRGSAADVERLKTLVFERILLGEKRRGIMQYLAKLIADKELKWPDKLGPSPRTVDYYIAAATVEIKTLSVVERSEAMSSARGRFLMIMKKAHDSGDLSTARLANRDLARIDGLEPVRVQHSGSVLTEHTGTVSHVHDHTHRAVTIDEQAERIRALFGVADARRIAAGTSTPSS